MNNEINKVVVMGQGYIGLPTAALIAQHKVEVIGVDTKNEVVDTINKGKIHIVEPALEGLVKNVVERGFLKASLQVEEADVFVITVPTPFVGNFQPDISFVEAASKAVIPFLKAGNLFIIESTSPVGTTEKIAKLIFSERPELIDNLYIAYCPERVLPGRIIYELENNDRVIGGIDSKSAEKAVRFYNIFVKAALHKTNAKTAEMCKLTENSSRDVNIAFANELSLICDKAGIDVWELISLANKHPRVNILQPGTGVGGHCIAVDPWFIVADFQEEARIIRTAREINNYKTSWVIAKIEKEIEAYFQKFGEKPTVALMGLAFKPDIDDLRESPAVSVANALKDKEKANVLVCEPNISSWKKGKLTDCLVAFNEANIVVYLVSHREFRLLPAIPEKIVLDFCGVKK